MSDTVFNTVLAGWVILGIAVFVSLFFIRAPYGRYARRESRLALGGRTGWIVMELASPLIFFLLFLSAETLSTAQVVFLIMWQAHYLDRAVIYPLTLRTSSRVMPLGVVFAGMVFNVMNSYLNASYILRNPELYPADWLAEARFILGIALFAVGFIVNRSSDMTLFRLRKVSRSEYDIPRGGLFRWVSCPNYLGEILIWLGWAVATWSPAAAGFLLWTIANLAPRARSHHAWYREQFSEYPGERHALIPGVW